MARASYVLVLAVIAAACRIPAHPAPPSRAAPPGPSRVVGQALHWARPCPGGGARVLPEDGELAATPLVGLELLVQPGSELAPVEPFASVTTGADGTWSVEVPDGTWCVYLAARRLPAEAPEAAPASPAAGGPPWFDPACLRAVRLQCDATFTVPGATRRQAEIAVVDDCPQPFNRPCYRGPLPP